MKTCNMLIEIYPNLGILIEPAERNRYLFRGLFYGNECMFENWIDVVDWVEIHQGFTKKILRGDMLYDQLRPVYFKVRKEESNGVLLLMQYQQYPLLKFSKLESNQISHKVNRILSRCDLFV